MMRLTVANISKSVPTSDFQTAIRALGRQVTEDFQPEWNIGAHLRGTTASIGKGKAPIPGIHDAIIYLGDSSQDPTTGVENALGYHSVNYKDIPYGFVYLDICAKYGEVWTATLSHEVLELLGDPTAVMTVTGPAPHKPSHVVHYDLEVCDPTQGDEYSVDHVAVSNFVGRSYFGLTGGSGKTNFLNLSLTPFGVRPGGYFQYEDNHGTHQIQGDKVTADHLAARKIMGNARRNARREARIVN